MRLNDLLEEEMSSLTSRLGRKNLRILETGTIRGTGEEYRDNDGWSTLVFAECVKEYGQLFYSVDLDVSVATQVLGTRNLLPYANLVKGYSVDVLARMLAGRIATFDLILLDTDNDAELILHEYLIARHLLSDEGGTILVDDVDLESSGVVKGHKLVPWLDANKTEYRIEKTSGTSYTTGVLVAEF